MADLVRIGGRPVGRLGQLPSADPLELARMRERADADAAEDERYRKRAEFTLENLLRGYKESGGHSGGSPMGYGSKQVAGHVGRAIGQLDWERRQRSHHQPPVVRPSGLPREGVHVQGGIGRPEESPELAREVMNALAGPGLRELLSGVAPEQELYPEGRYANLPLGARR